jgi:hypothetical protein
VLQMLLEPFDRRRCGLLQAAPEPGKGAGGGIRRYR